MLVFLFASLAATTSSAAPALDAQSLAWKEEWPRFRTSQYVATAALLAVDVALIFKKPPARASFTGDLLFDGPVRDFMRIHSKTGREKAGMISDLIYIPIVAFPIIVDALVVTTIMRGESDTGWQLAMIDLQSLAIAGFFALGTEKFAGRQRPIARECERDPSVDARCGTSDLNVSFLSGHAASSVGSAGLICVHHAHLALYGNELADKAACLGGIALAATTTILRLSADAHWATDLLAGALVGFVSGYLVPLSLHYAAGEQSIAVAPWRGDDVSGVIVAGSF